MEPSWIGHTKKGWVWNLDNQNFPFFCHEYHHEVLFSCLFYFTEPFSVSLEPQQVEGRRLRLHQSGSGRWGCQQIFQGRLEHMKYWGFKNRWFCCCGVDATHEIFKEGFRLHNTPPRVFSVEHFKQIPLPENIQDMPLRWRDVWRRGVGYLNLFLPCALSRPPRLPIKNVVDSTKGHSEKRQSTIDNQQGSSNLPG